MKEYIYNSKVLGIVATLLIFICVSCGEDELATYEEGGFQTVVDSYLQITTPVISFQAGTPDYTMQFNVVNGSKSIAKVNAYTVYTDSETGGQSERTALASFPVTTSTAEAVSATLTYDDLKNGVTVGGNALPADDLALGIGSNWVVSFEGEQADGTIVALQGTVNIAVLSRFAGIYQIQDMVYWRIGVDRDDVYASEIGNTRFIGSVDENTFSYNDYWGPFAWGGAQFNFDVDLEATPPYPITVPIIVAGLFSGNYATNCTDNADLLTNVAAECASGNILTPDDATGRHRIELVYGYFTEGSGAREFWEVLEKVVD